MALATPVLLTLGTGYATGAVFLSGGGDIQALQQNTTTAAGLAYTGGRFINNGSSTLTFPTSALSNGVLGGSFEVGVVSAVPEPSTYALALLGGAGLLGAVRRSRRA